MRSDRSPTVLSRGVLAASLLAGAALLAAAAPDAARGQARERPAEAIPAPPLPPERPDDLTPAPVVAPAIRDAPVPPERPPELAAPPPTPAAAGEATKPAEMPVPAPVPPGRPPELSGGAALALKVAAPDDTACRLRLKRLGVAFEPLPPISDGQCGAPLPLKLTALGDGIGLPQSATLTCGAAEALARWATEVQVAADRDLKQPLKGIAIGTSYECRGQNHDREAKLSEHAFANGIDVMAFAFTGRGPVTVGPMPEGSAEGRFLDAVRAKACGLFRTVLGPGANAEHGNHFHLDERERSGGHRLCQ